MKFQKRLITILQSFLFISFGLAKVGFMTEPDVLISPPFQQTAENSLDEPELYWEWDPEPRWLRGIDWGGLTFFGSLGYGETFLGSTLSFYDAIDVEIRFSNDETTYCQTYRRDLGYDAAGVGIFRGSAWDISNHDNPRRLNLCFVEWDDGTGEHDPNLLWDPDDSYQGRREDLFIMMSDYDGTGTTYDNENWGPGADVIYGWWPKLEPDYSFFETDPATLEIRLAYITDFSSISGDEQLTLQWEFEEGGIDHFDLYYSYDGIPDILVDQLSPMTQSYVHSGLPNDVKVYYQLKGINSSGDIIYSSQRIWGKAHPTAVNMTLLGTWDERSSYGDIWGYTDANTGIEYALMCARSEGLSIIDITNEPVEVGFISATGNNPDAKDVKVYDHYAILIEERAPAQVIDLSDPTNPNVVSTIEFSGGGAHNCYIDGQYLYAVGHDIDGFEIYDMSDPQSPTLVGQYLSNYYHDIFVRDGKAYGAGIYGEGVDIIDVSDFSQIQLLANVNYDGSGVHNCWTTEDGNYLIVGDEIGNGPWNRIFDIQDLDNISMVAEVIVDGDAKVHNSYVKGNLLYVGHYTEGVRIVDLEDPTNPIEIAYYDTYLTNEYGYYGCWAVYPYLESGKLIASDLQSGLFVLEHNPPLAIETSISPEQYSLHQNYPNPFNPSTRIEYSIGLESFVDLSVYDVSGNFVKTLVKTFQQNGKHSLQWDGTNEMGNKVPSGIYFIKIKTEKFIQSRKMILLK